jgi:predicted DCC family thiol-disulfide oxidoreductase YuxK
LVLWGEKRQGFALERSAVEAVSVGGKECVMKDDIGGEREQTPSSCWTVYFDGSCALCSLEIAHYAALPAAGDICFVDVSSPGVLLNADLSREAALSRFHVRRPDGTLVSGAAAFVEIWKGLPGWRWGARLARFPGVLWVLESGYRVFLPIRPVLSRLVSRLGVRSYQETHAGRKARND